MDDVGVDLPEGLLDHIRGGRAAIVVGAGWGDAARPCADGGVQAANVAEKGVLCPAVLVSEPHLSRAGEGETAFDLAKKLAYFRPERYVFFALPSLPRLEAALAA